MNPAAHRDAVGMLYGNLIPGIVVTIMAFSGLVYGFADNPDTEDKRLVLWVVIAVSLLRLLDYLIYQKECRSSTPPVRPFLRFFAGNSAISCIWAFYSLYFFSAMQMMEVASTMVVLASMAGGGATVLAPSSLISAIYCTCLLFPMSVLAMLSPIAEFQLLGNMGIIFWLVMLITNRGTNHFFTQVILLKEDNAELLRNMQQEQAEVSRVNRALKDANDALDKINSNLEYEVAIRTRELRQLSEQDSLTGMLNRAAVKHYLNRQLAQATKCQQSLAVFFIDLDGFKQINDSLGHAIGDTILATIGHRLTEQFPGENVARWGGDEFIITLSNLNEAQALEKAQSIRLTILQPVICDDNRLQLDATIGISRFPTDADSGQALIQKADFAMYQLKRREGSRVSLYDEARFADALLAVKYREGLKSAIENQQLTVAYQPIVDAETHQLVSCESLMRWSFNGATVTPDVFIPLAEQTGFITRLGIWILERACTEMMALPVELRPPNLSVNVSVLQLNSQEFIRQTDRILAETGFDPRRLHFEITESVFAQDKDIIRQRVSEIKARHIRLSIDDFGTGFSSLSQLQLLSFNYIKIDKSFVLTPSAANEAIIRSTLMLAREFGCQTVAEGIESSEHAERLQQLGVDFLQGFYFARPMPISELKVYLQQQR